MRVITLPSDSVLTVCSLDAANQLFIKETGKKPQRLLASSVYPQGRVLEIIFKLFGGLDLPFERSMVLPEYAWMLVHDDGEILYTKGISI